MIAIPGGGRPAAVGAGAWRWMMLGGLLATMLLGVAIGRNIALDPLNGGYILIAVALAAVITYILHLRTFERLMSLTLLCLPFQAAFVIERGLTVRSSHILGALAVVFGLYLHRLRRVPGSIPLVFLRAFLLWTVLSIVMTMNLPSVAPAEALRTSGIRASALRPVIQCLQLAGMVAIMCATMAFCQRWSGFVSAAKFICLGSTLVVLYGLYGFLAPALGIPYIDINNAQNSNYTFGARNVSVTFQGVNIPRPRSTFVEPLNFANFLLLGIPLSVASMLTAARRSRRAILGGLVAVATFVFLTTVSRGATVAVLATTGVMILCVRSRKAGLAFAGGILAAAAFVLVIAFVVVPLLHPRMTAATIVEFAWYQVESTQRLQGRGGTEVFFSYLPLIVRYPWLGVGFGNIQFYGQVLEGIDLIGVGGEIGLYWRLLVEIGIPGTLMYLLCLGSVLWGLLELARARETGRERRIYAAALFFALVADAVQRITLVGIANDTHLWVMLGMAVMLPRLRGGSERGAAGDLEGTRPIWDEGRVSRP